MREKNFYIKITADAKLPSQKIKVVKIENTDSFYSEIGCSGLNALRVCCPTFTEATSIKFFSHILANKCPEASSKLNLQATKIHEKKILKEYVDDILNNVITEESVFGDTILVDFNDNFEIIGKEEWECDILKKAMDKLFCLA